MQQEDGPTPQDELERQLAAVEGASSADALPPAGAMRRDRALLRGALSAEFSRPAPAQVSARLEQAVANEIERAALAGLADGTPIRFQPGTPGLGSGATAHRWRFAIPAAIAACLALVAGACWLAFSGPRGVSAPVAQGGAPARREALPAWAVLPEKPAPTAPPVAAAPAPEKTRSGDPLPQLRETRDAALALTWARRGTLAIRLSTDSPRRDRERMDSIASRDFKDSAWSLAPNPGSMSAVAPRPWPINTAIAASETPPAGQPSAPPPAHPASASLAGYDLTLRPTVEALEGARTELEHKTHAIVTFERVENAPREAPVSGVPANAPDILWWTRPADEWSLRVRVPVVLEFGRPDGAGKGAGR